MEPISCRAACSLAVRERQRERGRDRDYVKQKSYELYPLFFVLGLKSAEGIAICNKREIKTAAICNIYSGGKKNYFNLQKMQSPVLPSRS